MDGSLYAQIKKRRGPGSQSSTNGSSTGAGLPEDLHLKRLNDTSESALSAHPSHLNHLSAIHSDAHQKPAISCPPAPTRREQEELERLLGGIEGHRDAERETAILDDGDSLPSDQTGMLGLSQSCSHHSVSYRSQHCSEPGCDSTLLMPNGFCLERAPGTSGHHGDNPSASPSLGAPPSHMDLCQHYSPHSHQSQSLPPPDLVLDRQSGPNHYLQHPCSEVSSSRHLCPYAPSELPHHSQTHPHHYPLSLPSRHFCREGDYGPYHPPPLHSRHHAHPHHPKPSSHLPCHDLIQMEGMPPACCPCRDCSISREESAAYHCLRLDRGDSFHWDREAGLPQREMQMRRAREAELPRGGSEIPWEGDPRFKRGRESSLHWERDREAELQWERDRDTEFWHRRDPMVSYGSHSHNHTAFTFDPLPSGHPAYPEASRSHTHSHLDLKYSSSNNGYPAGCQVCPCSPYQPSPSESRGYASGYQSESTSPLPPASSSGPCSHNNVQVEQKHNPHHHHSDAQQPFSSDSHTGESHSSSMLRVICANSVCAIHRWHL